LHMTTVQESPNGHRILPPSCDDASSIVVPGLEPERGISPEPLPSRCQFTFSDGRQCTMARSDIHPSLCRFHADREAQLFGDPAPGGNVVGSALDLPELHSACRDLTSATGVNRALAQVFRLLAQRRISREEAATFGYLAQLLLQTADPTSPPRKGYQQDELSPAKEVQREPRDFLQDGQNQQIRSLRLQVTSDEQLQNC
jgi:hypothetical protein